MTARLAAVAAICLLIAGGPGPVAAQHSPARARDILIYTHIDCPHCQEAKRYLDELQRRQPALTVQRRELSTDSTAAADLQRLARAHGYGSAGVPAFLIGGRVLLLGFDRQSTPQQIERILRELGLPAAGIGADIRPVGPERPLSLPLLGEVSTEALSLPAMTALIAFVDGFNPCSLWVITFLLGIIVHSGSRRRIAVVGTTFLLVTATAYGGFMLGLFTTLRYIAYIPWVTAVVATVALLFAVINIKDYFWFQQGVSLTISDRHKPRFYQRVRNLMQPGRSLAALLAGTVVLALGIMLVELPCTAGFPMVWSSIMASREVGLASFAALFALYLSIYLLDEFAVVGAALITMRRSRLDERHGRLLKLVGGVVMLALAVALLAAPRLMHSLAGTLLVFASAALVIGAILLLHRVVLPRFGVRIGTTPR